MRNCRDGARGGQNRRTWRAQLANLFSSPAWGCTLVNEVRSDALCGISLRSCQVRFKSSISTDQFTQVCKRTEVATMDGVQCQGKACGAHKSGALRVRCGSRLENHQIRLAWSTVSMVET